MTPVLPIRSWGRYLPAALALFLVVAHSALALRYGEVLGTWRGSLAETGPASARLGTVLQISTYGKSGLALVQKITNSHGDVFIVRTRLNGQGKLLRVATVGNFGYFRGSGTWSSGRTTIRMKASLTYFDGTLFEETTTLTFRGNRVAYRNQSTSGYIEQGILRRRAR